MKRPRATTCVSWHVKLSCTHAFHITLGVDVRGSNTLYVPNGSTVDMTERRSSMGLMLITRRETTYTNQDGQVVCRGYGTGLTY